jgi:hypothetical protein
VQRATIVVFGVASMGGGYAYKVFFADKYAWVVHFLKTYRWLSGMLFYPVNLQVMRVLFIYKDYRFYTCM